MTEQDFNDIVDAAYALMTAPFILFLVALVIAAVAVAASAKQ